LSTDLPGGSSTSHGSGGRKEESLLLIRDGRQGQAAGQTPPLMPASSSRLPTESIEHLIFTIRGQRVILDADLARLYGVPTKQFNQAFRRSRDRFPPDFAFQLTAAEFAGLRSQIVTSNVQVVEALVLTHNSSHSVTSSRGGRRYRPWAFTEHGALMAANILRSARARQLSVFVVRAFLRMRAELASGADILKRLAGIDRKLLVHDLVLRDIYRKLQPLLSPPPGRPRREIGFHVK